MNNLFALTKEYALKWFLFAFFTIFSLYSFIALAISFPSSTPSWQISWWSLTTYFDKIFQTCDAWYFLQWINRNSWKVCVPKN